MTSIIRDRDYEMAAGQDRPVRRMSATARLWTVASAYGIWLLAVEIVFYLGHGKNEDTLQLAVMGGMVPAVLQLLLVGINPYGLVSSARLSLLFLLVITLSYVANPVGWTSFVYIINTAYVFALAIMVAGSTEPRLLRSIGAVFSVASVPFLLYIAITGEYVWGRLEAAGIESNFWGLMGMSTAILALGLGSRLLGTAGFVVGTAVVYLASSRSSMLGLGVALIFLAISHGARLRDRKLVTGFAMLAIFLIIVGWLSPHIAGYMKEVLDNVFKLDDPLRGVGQGFTGRSDLWRDAFNLWVNSPLFGVGFRQHEKFLPNAFSAHNAYLAMLADTGLFGFLLYVALLLLSAYAALHVTDRRTRDLCLIVVASYAVIGFFERRAINSGNPYGIFFLFCCFYAMTQQQLGKALRRHPERAPETTVSA